jgi:hypothetical protein
MSNKESEKNDKIGISQKRTFAVIFFCFIFAIGIFYYVYYLNNKKLASDENETVQAPDQVKAVEFFEIEEPISKKLKDPPDEIRALYLTGWSAGNSKKMDEIIGLIEKEKLNSVVIDIKDYSGYISYQTGIEEISKYKAEQIMIKDIDELLKKIHDKNIYAIARVTVFQDPVLAVARPELAIKNKVTGGIWKDNKGLAWIDPASSEAWDYVIKIAKDASERGFDEINFDYIRFPSDGALGNMSYPFYSKEGKEKHEVIKEFFLYLRTNLPGIIISADLFGLATINSGDLGIGQTIEDAYENFDYVSPMVYPSHYANGFIGFKNPAEYPYEVVKYSMEKGAEKLSNLEKIKKEENSDQEIKLAKLRPWLQAFDMGAVYGPEKVKAQIRASNEAGGSGWILWNASNNYSSKIAGIND